MTFYTALFAMATRFEQAAATVSLTLSQAQELDSMGMEELLAQMDRDYIDYYAQQLLEQQDGDDDLMAEISAESGSESEAGSESELESESSASS